jgi:hypothetical protein
LRNSEKELKERRSDAFPHKNSPGVWPWKHNRTLGFRSSRQESERNGNYEWKYGISNGFKNDLPEYCFKFRKKSVDTFRAKKELSGLET